MYFYFSNHFKHLFNFQYASKETLAGERIRVITIDHEPFVDISIDESTGAKVYEGMCAELIQSLAEKENFTIDWMDTLDDKFVRNSTLDMPKVGHLHNAQ